MTHYVAILEEEDGKAVGVWFPDLHGCVSAGDTLYETMLNAAEALELWAEAMIESGQKIPSPRSLIDLKADSEIAQDLAQYMMALMPFPQRLEAVSKAGPLPVGRAKCASRRARLGLIAEQSRVSFAVVAELVTALARAAESGRELL